MKGRDLRTLFITYIIILAVATVAFVIRLLSGRFEPQLNIFLLFSSAAIIASTWEALRWLHRWLNKVFPFERSIPGRITLQLGIGVTLAITLRYALYKLGEPYLPVHLDMLFLASTWAMVVIAATGMNSIFIADYFIDRWKDSIVQAERLEKEKAQIQFDNLRNQLNPHFLFNALTSLNSLITDNPQLATQFLQHMSKVYRYVLQNKDRNTVSLGTEMDFIRNYVFLIETRFGGALKIVFDIREDALELSIVPVTLQILIENALKHNIIDPDQPLTLDVFTSGDYIVVTNPLQLRKTVETSNGLGLANLKSLYQFLTHRDITVETSDTRFTVKVPLL